MEARPNICFDKLESLLCDSDTDDDDDNADSLATDKVAITDLSQVRPTQTQVTDITLTDRPTSVCSNKSDGHLSICSNSTGSFARSDDEDELSCEAVPGTLRIRISRSSGSDAPSSGDLSPQSPNGDLSTQSPGASGGDLSRQSPDGDLSQQSPNGDLSTQSPGASGGDHSRQSPDGDLSRQSPDADRSPQSPDVDLSPHSGGRPNIDVDHQATPEDLPNTHVASENKSETVLLPSSDPGARGDSASNEEQMRPDSGVSEVSMEFLEAGPHPHMLASSRTEEVISPVSVGSVENVMAGPGVLGSADVEEAGSSSVGVLNRENMESGVGVSHAQHLIKRSRRFKIAVQSRLEACAGFRQDEIDQYRPDHTLETFYMNMIDTTFYNFPACARTTSTTSSKASAPRNVPRSDSAVDRSLPVPEVVQPQVVADVRPSTPKPATTDRAESSVDAPTACEPRAAPEIEMSELKALKKKAMRRLKEKKREQEAMQLAAEKLKKKKRREKEAIQFKKDKSKNKADGKRGILNESAPKLNHGSSAAAETLKNAATTSSADTVSSSVKESKVTNRSFNAHGMKVKKLPVPARLIEDDTFVRSISSNSSTAAKSTTSNSKMKSNHLPKHEVPAKVHATAARRHSQPNHIRHSVARPNMADLHRRHALKRAPSSSMTAAEAHKRRASTGAARTSAKSSPVLPLPCFQPGIKKLDPTTRIPKIKPESPNSRVKRILAEQALASQASVTVKQPAQEQQPMERTTEYDPFKVSEQYLIAETQLCPEPTMIVPVFPIDVDVTPEAIYVPKLLKNLTAKVHRAYEQDYFVYKDKMRAKRENPEEKPRFTPENWGACKLYVVPNHVLQIDKKRPGEDVEIVWDEQTKKDRRGRHRASNLEQKNPWQKRQNAIENRYIGLNLLDLFLFRSNSRFGDYAHPSSLLATAKPEQYTRDILTEHCKNPNLFALQVRLAKLHTPFIHHRAHHHPFLQDLIIAFMGYAAGQNCSYRLREPWFQHPDDPLFGTFAVLNVPNCLCADSERHESERCRVVRHNLFVAQSRNRLRIAIHQHLSATEEAKGN